MLGYEIAAGPDQINNYALNGNIAERKQGCLRWRRSVAPLQNQFYSIEQRPTEVF